MKYLKLYEDVSDWYQEISHSEYMSLLHNVEIFDRNEVDRIKNTFEVVLRSPTIKVKIYYKGQLTGSRFDGKNATCLEISDGWGLEVFIRKLADEYYMLNGKTNKKRGTYSYRCDQIDGLISCIKNEIL